MRSLLTKKIAPPPSLAWLSSMIVPAIRSGELVAVAVDRAAAAAARACRPWPGWRRCRSPGCAVNTLLSTDPGHADAAERRRRSSRPPPAKVLFDDVDRQVLVLAEHPDAPRRPGPGRSRSQRLRTKRELTTLNRPPRTKIAPPPPPSVRVAGGVAVGEGEVLHGELRVVLVLAVRGGPALGLVAGVHVEDAALAAAAQGDLAAAVEHDPRPVGVARPSRSRSS